MDVDTHTDPTMSTNVTEALETFATPRRAARGCTEAMTVIQTDADDTYVVSSSSGSTYAVSTTGPMTCSCPDVEHNLETDERCKHQHRVAYATGETPIPAAAREEIDAVLEERVEDDDWGAHYEQPAADADAAVAADGGECEACAELPGDYPCADCYVTNGDKTLPGDA